MSYKITVEPILLLYMLSGFMLYPSLQDLIYTKICLNKYSTATCNNLYDPINSDALDNVQKSSSHWILSSTLMLTLPSIFSAQFLGTWSDIYGRKIFLMIPPIGGVLSSFLYIGQGFYLEKWPVSLILFSSFVSGVCGGFISCILMCISYMAEITSKESRTMRISIVEAMIFVGGTLGPLLAGWIQKTLGRNSVFVSIMALFSTIVIYIIVFVEDIPPRQIPEVPWSKGGFSLNHLKGPVVTISKSREDGKRFNLTMLLLSAGIIMLCSLGELDVSYIYLKDKPIQWSLSSYTSYISLKYGLGSFSLLLILPIFRKTADSILIVAGIISKMLGSIIIALAKNSISVYASASISFLSTWSIPVIRAAMSKLVEPQEQGQLFACIAMVEGACGIIAALVFNGLYPLTRHWFKGFIFFMEASLLLLPLGLTCYLHKALKNLNVYESIREELEPSESVESQLNVSSSPSPASMSPMSTPQLSSRVRKSEPTC